MILQDTDGIFWQVGVNDSGELTATIVGAGPGETVHLNRSGTSWLVGIITDGTFKRTEVTYNASYPSYFLIGDYAVEVPPIVDPANLLIAPRGIVVLEDDDGIFWQVSVDGSEELIGTVVGAGPADTIRLNQSGSSWLMGINTDGTFKRTEVSYNSSYHSKVLVGDYAVSVPTITGSEGTFQWKQVREGGSFLTDQRFYHGIDILAIDPNDTGEKSANYGRDLLILDPGPGAMDVNDRAGVALVKRGGIVWTMDGRAEIQAYRDFIDARKGSLVPFWMPTWRTDIVAAADLAAGETFLDIQNTKYAANQFYHESRRHVAFLFPDGTIMIRPILDATEDSEALETVELGSALPVDMYKDNVMICFLILCRLAVDDPELVWQTRDVAEANLSIVELPQEVAEVVGA